LKSTPSTEIDENPMQIVKVPKRYVTVNKFRSHLGISPQMAFQGYASGRPRANQN